MATDINRDIDGGKGLLTLITWTITNADPTGDKAKFAEYADRCVQAVGTFNGGAVVFEGSNDGTNWATLSDAQGNALTFTSEKIEQVLEVPRFARPRITAGTGVNVQILALCRRLTRG